MIPNNYLNGGWILENSITAMITLEILHIRVLISGLKDSQNQFLDGAKMNNS